MQKAISFVYTGTKSSIHEPQLSKGHLHSPLKRRKALKKFRSPTQFTEDVSRLLLNVLPSSLANKCARAQVAQLSQLFRTLVPMQRWSLSQKRPTSTFLAHTFLNTDGALAPLCTLFPGLRTLLYAVLIFHYGVLNSPQKQPSWQSTKLRSAHR